MARSTTPAPTTRCARPAPPRASASRATTPGSAPAGTPPSSRSASSSRPAGAGSDPGFQPLEIRFAHARASSRRAVERRLGCEVRFGSEATELVIGADQLALPVRLADPFLLAMLVRHAEAALAARHAGPDRLRGDGRAAGARAADQRRADRGRRRRRARHRRADAGAAADRRGRAVPPAGRRASARPGAELPRRPRAVAGAGRLSARLCRPERLLQRLQALDRPLAPPLPREA